MGLKPNSHDSGIPNKLWYFFMLFELLQLLVLVLLIFKVRTSMPV